MNVRQDQVVPGDPAALARAAFSWHIDRCAVCRMSSHLCDIGQRLRWAVKHAGAR